MPTILVADNHQEQIDKITEILVRAGYQVVPATNPNDAKIILDSGGVDLAVLDLKLTDDSEEDISGLDVARHAAPMLPKIIVSSYSNPNEIVQALGPNAQGLPAVIAFLPKVKLNSELLPAVQRALEIKKTWFRRTQDEISEQLSGDYKHARRVAQFHTWTSFALSIIFALPIVYGVWKLHSQGALTMVFIFIGSLGAEITNYIFARKLEFLYQRVDKFHTELLQVGRFEQLLAVCEEIKDESTRKQFRKQVLESALGRWLGSAENSTAISSRTLER